MFLCDVLRRGLGGACYPAVQLHQLACSEQNQVQVRTGSSNEGHKQSMQPVEIAPVAVVLYVHLLSESDRQPLHAIESTHRKLLLCPAVQVYVQFRLRIVLS